MIFLLVSFCSTKTRVNSDTKVSIITHCCSKTYKNIQLKSYTFQNLNAIDLTKIYDKAVCDTLWDDTHTSYAPLFQCNKVLRLTYRSPVEFDVSQVGADAGFFGTDSVTVKVTGQDDERVAVGIWIRLILTRLWEIFINSSSPSVCQRRLLSFPRQLKKFLI